jgi:hypothetical protein
MANPEHLAILKQGVEAWNRWRKQQPNLEVDLTRADLEDERLISVNFHGVNLKRATLRGANLSQADLTWANLIHANLSEASLTGADLRDAYLIDTDLHRADLSDVDFQRAQLTEVNFSAAVLKGTDFTNALVSRLRLCEVDLAHAKGLEAIHHARGSSIDLAALQLSKRNIPEGFLKGIGLTDQFITYWSSLTEQAIEFHSSFISYSTRDQAFAERLYADLQAAGVRCWFAPHDIQGGRKIHEQIDEAIRVYDKLLLILSHDSMNSAWVRTEIANARVREVQQERQMLFPISLVPFSQIRSWKLLDGDTGIDSAREIREYFIPDFSNWKHHDSYQKAFDRLLRDLKATPSDKADSETAP